MLDSLWPTTTTLLSLLRIESSASSWMGFALLLLPAYWDVAFAGMTIMPSSTFLAAVLGLLLLGWYVATTESFSPSFTHFRSLLLGESQQLPPRPKDCLQPHGTTDAANRRHSRLVRLFFSSRMNSAAPAAVETSVTIAATTTTASTSSTVVNSSTTTAAAFFLSQPKAWWEEVLSRPFAMMEDDEEFDRVSIEQKKKAASTAQDDSADDQEGNSAAPQQPALVTHFCFLVHGHRGFSRDLSYLQYVMERTARKLHPPPQLEEGGGEGVHPQAVHGSPQPRRTQELIVHASVCNERKTTDGVVNGGERLVEEMIHVVRTEMGRRRRSGRRCSSRHRRRRAQQQQQGTNEPVSTSQDADNKGDLDMVDLDPVESEANYYDVTISLLGNSLGGLYTRYAIAKFSERCIRQSDGCYLLDGCYRIHFNVFCTTASPHLGIAGHTFFPIPRSAEIGVAHAMGTTGRDLFRLNDLLKEMATSPQFLHPLRSFRKRVAYANAYGTDFPVPLHTAAFLSSASDYPHHFVEDSRDDARLVVDDNGLVIASLHTPPEHQSTVDPPAGAAAADATTSTECYFDHEGSDDLVLMSRSLDSLGWKKVFVDVRKQIPKIPLPPSFLLRRTVASSTGTSSSSESDSDSDDNNQEDRGGEDRGGKDNATMGPIHKLRQRKVIRSRDLAQALSAPLFDDDKFHWPMGHNMIVAFSRSRLSTYMNKAGRPVVDNIAAELVESIFGWTKGEQQSKR